MYRSRICIAVLLGASIVAAGHSVAFADSPSVTAVLSNSEAVVGEMVELQIKVSGSRDAEPPEEIVVNGLEIHATGTSRQFEMRNFTTTSSVTYNYRILPLQAGRFTIPPQIIQVRGKSLQTPELTLNVADSPGGSSASRPSQGAQPGNASRLGFAELIVPKKTAFVGEMVPVQIRLGFDPRAYPEFDVPEITGQGFTAQKLLQSGRNQETIDGRIYLVWTFKTAIAAARAGKFEIGPVKAKAQVVVSRSRRSPRGRSPFDLFSMDDPFSDPFFANPFGRFGERREVEVKSDPVPLEVKPLPPGAPADFSGAIGNFTMTTEAKPKSVQVGDPITVTSAISGRGNFDRVGAPVIENERGWHKYPPSSKFAKDDEVGISGTKTFESVLSPNEKKESLPVMEFAYFDPVKEQYVTLRSDPIAISVQGGAVAAAVPPGSPATASPPGSPTPTTVQKPQDILYQLPERPKVAQSFTPLYARPIFWAGQLIPLLALLGLIGWKIRQSRIGNREARRIAALQHEAAELMRKLHRGDASPREYYAEASRVVRVKAALASGGRQIDPNTVDVETAADTFRLNGDSRERLRRLFEQSDELQYSGAHNGAEKISPEIRRDVLELIENLK
ncbi:MAG TPA: BatD family protein [Candidatus Baltobacteraceae bacterium]|nr:BatD family protein [Candidatus Baltobacteraceae bacterium]